MNKFYLLLIVGVVIVFLLLSQVFGQSVSKSDDAKGNFQNMDTRPNILIILADDLGYADVGFTGSKDIKTPHLDKLANNGIIFTNGYVTHPYCGPSRAGLLTGRYQARFGMEVNPSYSPYDLYMGLPLSEVTIASRLKSIGYRTGIVGKWHLGAAPPYHPNNRGFDHFYGFLCGGHFYFPETVTTLTPLCSTEGIPNYQANEGCFRPLSLNDGAGEFNEYLTTALSRDAANFIKSSQQPFMLYLAYNAPHTPLQAPKKTIEKYKFIENKSRRTYAAMIDKMDEGIGMVIEALRETGKLENTLIFFLSDNGGLTKRKKFLKEAYASNYPFKNGKGSMYEGGIHVPFILYWPSQISNPQKFEGIVSSLDITATVLAITGADTANANLDGVNLIPFLNNQQKGSPHEALFWRDNEGIAWAVRTHNLKFVLSDSQKIIPELFDMKRDPYESSSIIDLEPEQRKIMAKLWNDWNKENQPVILYQPREYQKKRLEMYQQLHKELEEKALKRSMKVIK